MPDPPYTLATHDLDDGAFALEFAPREGSWSPVIAAIPLDNGAEVIRLGWGVTGDPTSIGGRRLDVIIGPREIDGVWWEFHQVGNPPAMLEQPYFLVTSRRPSRILFGNWEQHWYWPDCLEADGE